MGRLSHIDDVEQRQTQEATAPEQAVVPQPRTSEQAEHVERVATQNAAPQARVSTAAAQRTRKSAAQQDMDFHGLNDTHDKSSGHTALVVLAIVILVVIVAYVVNYNM